MVDGNKLLLFILLGVSLIAQPTQAQIELGTEISTSYAGTAASAPNAGKKKIEYLFLKTVIQRLNEIDMDAVTRSMRANGISELSQSLSLKGAVYYEADGLLNPNAFLNHRDVGMEALPFSIDILPNGDNRISFSAFQMRNLEESTTHPYFPTKYINGLEILTFSWDNHYSFKDLRIFDVAIVGFRPRLPLVYDPAHLNHFIALQGSIAGGLDGAIYHDRVSNLDRHYGGNSIPSDATPASDGEANYGGGQAVFYGLAIEARHEGKKGSLVDFTAGWKGGASGGYMRDDAITNANAIWENDYNAQLATYNKEYGAFESAKQNYINQHQNLYPSSGNPLQDSTYATISRRPLPVAPTVPGYPNDQVRINRSWGSIVSSLEYSRVVSGKNTKRKVRAGASLNFTDPIYSRFKGGALNVDLAKEYQPWLMGRFFIRF